MMEQQEKCRVKWLLAVNNFNAEKWGLCVVFIIIINIYVLFLT